MMMDDGDWYFLFVHNPDGYTYSWTNVSSIEHTGIVEYSILTLNIQ